MRNMIRAAVLAALLAFAAPAFAQYTGPSLPAQSSGPTGAVNLCQARCTMWTASITTGSSAGYWMVFDSPTIPSDGVLRVTPKYCWYWPANYSNGWFWPGGIPFVTGMTFVFSTGTDCAHKTASQTAFFTVQVQQQ